MKKFISLFLVFSILLLSGNLFAKERRGANIEIYKTKPKTEVKMEGTPWESTKLKGESADLRGELIAVKENSILLLDKESGADVTVDVGDIRVIRIVKKSKALLGGGIGLLVAGGGGALIAFVTLEKNNDRLGITGLIAAFSAGIGLLIGTIVGASAGTDKIIQLEGKSDSDIQEILEKLRKKARVKNAQ